MCEPVAQEMVPLKTGRGGEPKQGAAALENSPAGARIIVTEVTSNATPRHLPKKNETPKLIRKCSQQRHAQQPKGGNDPQAHQGKSAQSERGHPYGTGYESVTKSSGGLTRATAWLNLANVMRRERSRPQKPTFTWSCLYELSGKIPRRQAKSWLLGAVEGLGGREATATGRGSGERSKVDCGDGRTCL